MSQRERTRSEPAEHLAQVIAVQQEIATADLDLPRMMTLVARRAMELTHASGAVVEMVEGREMVYRAATGRAEPFVGLRLPAGASLSGLCVAERLVLRADDTETDPRVDRAACRRVGARSMIVVPLMFRDHAVGVLKVISPEPAWFHDGDTSTLQLMAGLIAAAVAHAEAFAQQTRAGRRRTAELESLLANAPIAIAFFDREHRYVRVNQALEAVNLLPASDHIGRTLLEVLGERGRLLDERVEKVFGTHEPARCELDWMVTPGDVRRFLAVFFPMDVDDEQPLVGAYLVDLTEQRRDQQELERSHALIDAILTVSPDVIYVKDRESRMRFANPAALALIGKPESEVFGRTDVEFLGPGAERILENDRRIMARGETETIEEYVPVEGGPPRVFLSTKSPHRGRNGEVVGLIGISKEITERKQAEQRLRSAASEIERQRAQLVAVFQAVKDGIVVFDRDGKVVLLNDAEAEICGYPDAESMRRDLAYFTAVFELSEIGGPLIPVEDWPVSHVLAGRSVRDRQLHGQRVDTGQEWFFSFSGEPVHESQGEMIMAVLITRDITAIKRAELALREGVRLRDEFVSVASHELKTPVTALHLQVESLRRLLLRGDVAAIGPARIGKFAEQTAKQTARLGQLVDDMLDMSRIAAGRLSVEPKPMDLSAAVVEVVERLRPQLEASNGRIDVHVQDAVRGAWDRSRIEQVVVNLLTNAMRYGKGCPVEVSLRRLGDVAHLTVRDHGIGIARDDLARIFDRFERAISANEVSGLGLGLFISRQIVEAHRGRLWAESELGNGAAFHVELPL